MTTDPAESRTPLQGAMEALKRGDRVTAQRLAQQAAALAPETEAPWLILAALASPAESLEYARKALQINPDSQPARQAWDWAMRRLPAQPAEAKVEQPAEAAPPAEAVRSPEPVQPAEFEEPAEEIQPVEGEDLPAQVGAGEAEPAAGEMRTPDSEDGVAESPGPKVKRRKKGLNLVVLVLVIFVVVVLAMAVVARFTFLKP